MIIRMHEVTAVKDGLTEVIVSSRASHAMRMAELRRAAGWSVTTRSYIAEAV